MSGGTEGTGLTRKNIEDWQSLHAQWAGEKDLVAKNKLATSLGNFSKPLLEEMLTLDAADFEDALKHISMDVVMDSLDYGHRSTQAAPDKEKKDLDKQFLNKLSYPHLTSNVPEGHDTRSERWNIVNKDATYNMAKDFYEKRNQEGIKENELRFGFNEAVSGEAAPEEPAIEQGPAPNNKPGGPGPGGM